MVKKCLFCIHVLISIYKIELLAKVGKFLISESLSHYLIEFQIRMGMHWLLPKTVSWQQVICLDNCSKQTELCICANKYSCLQAFLSQIDQGVIMRAKRSLATRSLSVHYTLLWHYYHTILEWTLTMPVFCGQGHNGFCSISLLGEIQTQKQTQTYFSGDLLE